jgi:hypothetical protein
MERTHETENQPESHARPVVQPVPQGPSDAPTSNEERERDTYRSKEKVPTPSNVLVGV